MTKILIHSQKTPILRSQNLSTTSTSPCQHTGQYVKLLFMRLALNLDGQFLLPLLPRRTPPTQIPTRCHIWHPSPHLKLDLDPDLSTHLKCHRNLSLRKDPQKLLVPLHPKVKPSADPVARLNRPRRNSKEKHKQEKGQPKPTKLWSHTQVQVYTRLLPITSPLTLLRTNLVLSKKLWRPLTHHNGPPPFSMRWALLINTAHIPLWPVLTNGRLSDPDLHSKSRMPRRQILVSTLGSSPKAKLKLPTLTSKIPSHPSSNRRLSAL